MAVVVQQVTNDHVAALRQLAEFGKFAAAGQAELAARFLGGELAAGFWKIEPSPDALSAFSAHLVSIGLTQWQCDKLRIGKWKGFFLDDYELIDFAGTEDDRRIYLARRSRPGPIVRLAVICQK